MQIPELVTTPSGIVEQSDELKFAEGNTLALLRGEVHLWNLPVVEPEVAGEAENWWLDAAEREQAQSFLFEKDRLLYVSSHAWLRRILASYLHCAHPAALRFEHAASGKPSLEKRFQTLPSPLHFNLSHTHGAIVIGLSMVGEIGVDVERVRPVLDIERLFSGVLHDTELQSLRAMGDDQRQLAFHRLWTIKEAYTKALGTGLAHPFGRVVVSLGAGCRYAVQDQSGLHRTHDVLCTYSDIIQSAAGVTCAVAAAAFAFEGPMVRHSMPDGSHLCSPLSRAVVTTVAGARMDGCAGGADSTPMS